MRDFTHKNFELLWAFNQMNETEYKHTVHSYIEVFLISNIHYTND